MKKLYVPLLATLLVLCTQNVSAQITADSVPPGMFAVNPYVALSVSPCGTPDSMSIDIDCDGSMDFRFELYKGFTVIDGANTAHLFILNDSIEVCIDTGGMISGFPRPHYFNTGDALIPPVNSMWGGDSIYQFGDYGCMMCGGPYTQSNMYVAFRNAGQTSWMKVSFNLVDGGSCVTPITFNVHLVLSPCMGSGISESENAVSVVAGPNPFSDAITISSSASVSNGTLTLYDSRGEIVSQMTRLSGQSFVLKRNELAAGMYFFTLSDEGTLLCSRKIMIAD